MAGITINIQPAAAESTRLIQGVPYMASRPLGAPLCLCLCPVLYTVPHETLSPLQAGLPRQVTAIPPLVPPLRALTSDIFVVFSCVVSRRAKWSPTGSLGCLEAAVFLALAHWVAFRASRLSAAITSCLGLWRADRQRELQIAFRDEGVVLLAAYFTVIPDGLSQHQMTIGVVAPVVISASVDDCASVYAISDVAHEAEMSMIAALVVSERCSSLKFQQVGLQRVLTMLIRGLPGRVPSLSESSSNHK